MSTMRQGTDAERALRNYAYELTIMKALLQQIEEINVRMEGLKSSVPTGEPVTSSGNGREEELCFLICEKGEKELRYGRLRLISSSVKIALAELSEEDNMILRIAYIDQLYAPIVRLSEKMHCSVSEVHRRKLAALGRFEKIWKEIKVSGKEETSR